MRLSEWPEHAQAAADKIKDTGPLVTRLALITVGPVKRRTRVRTGALRNSLHDRTEPNKAIVATNMGYAPYVNARFPFMETGLDDAMPQIERELNNFGLSIAKAAGA